MISYKIILNLQQKKSPCPTAVVLKLLPRLNLFPESLWVTPWNVSFSFKSSAIFSLFSLFVLRSQWSCGWKMKSCEKCSPGIRYVGCSDGKPVSHHEESVRLREAEISEVCGELVKVEVTECHPLWQCKTGTSRELNFQFPYGANLVLEQEEQFSLLFHCPHDSPGSSGNRVLETQNLPSL